MGNERNEYNDCILLNYWVYSRLVNIFQSDDASIIAGPFAILQRIWHDIVEKPSYKPRNNKCFPDGTLVTQKDWRERKALYDYCVNYDTIKKTIPSYEKICPEYWSYVDSHTSLFEYFKTRCSKTNDQCPEFYNNCKQYDPKEFLLTFSCNEQMKQKKADTLAKARQALQSSTADVQEQISRITGGSEVSAGGSLLTSDGSHPVEKTELLDLNYSKYNLD
ncbi:hypothetical protein PVNG_05019 [Plasmodium vivax North Korean]|uniref:Variable surface protein Vir4 n=1 Tax=Plasmodium vivax North Korean TaxID=1035514 RepID=A0A0J9U339_PLAVI|nr:hypothetical protein PVNG_05019 [Plasmodium vivax North Korean]